MPGMDLDLYGQGLDRDSKRIFVQRNQSSLIYAHIHIHITDRFSDVGFSEN